MLIIKNTNDLRFTVEVNAVTATDHAALPNSHTGDAAALLLFVAKRQNFAHGMVEDRVTRNTSNSASLFITCFDLISSYRDGVIIFLWPSHYRCFTITIRHVTIGRIPLDEWSARRINLYLTIHNTTDRQTSMTPAGIEPTISAGERTQTYVLDRAATGTGGRLIYTGLICW